MLKLQKLPDRVPVKVSISLPPELHRDLGEYATLYRENYGEEEAVVDLIPAMLASFLESDRSFRRHSRKPGS